MDYNQALKGASISIDEARDNNSKDLFAINTSDLDGRFQKGEAIINIAGTDGRSHRIVIPDTWVPWELTHFFPKEKWLSDTVFVRNVRRHVITLVNSKIAKEILDSPDGILEYDRCQNALTERERGNYDGRERLEEETRNIANQQTVRDAIKVNNPNSSPPRSTREVKVDKQPDIRIVTIMNNPGFAEAERINALRNIQGQITASDVRWILDRCKKEDSKLKQWLIELKKN